jgi:hypothetical protein
LFGPNPSGQSPHDAFSIARNLRTPRYHNFNLSVQRELAHNSVLTVGYSGQRGKDLIIYRDLNATPVGTMDLSDPENPVICVQSGCDPYRPLSGSFIDPVTGGPYFRHVIQATNLARSQYDSLQTSFSQRGWHGLDTTYNLTWSKCLDYNSNNRGGSGGNYPQVNNSNPVGSTEPATVNVRDNRGQCDHDVRLNFNVSGVYEFPTIRPLGHRLGGGWQISTIFTGISGRPFTPILGGNDTSGQGLIGNSIRPSWDGTPIHYNTRNPDQYVVENFIPDNTPGQFDPCGRQNFDPSNTATYEPGAIPLTPFFRPCNGTTGNLRRNKLIGPGLAQWDLTLTKNTKINERLNVELRWEVFNVLNRGNFYYFPNNSLSQSAGFGQIKSTSDVAVGNPVIAQGGPRNMNLSLKFTF